MNLTAPDIETARLLLRQITNADAAALFQIFGDEEAMRYWLTRDLTIAQTHERIERMIQQWQAHGFGDWAVVDKKSRKMIGYCGLHFIKDMAEVNLGYLFASDSWGKGYATETGKLAVRFGFEQAGLRQIVGVTRPANQASIKVLEKCGLSFWKEIIWSGEPRVVYLAGEKP
ncbi:MAG: GNAT family N-acetyltransferase [Deltaproteobacteria bacterium]|nr:GNAT family N-acetyltransferase [Deltaproteobacteria bacterium]